MVWVDFKNGKIEIQECIEIYFKSIHIAKVNKYKPKIIMYLKDIIGNLSIIFLKFKINITKR